MKRKSSRGMSEAETSILDSRYLLYYLISQKPILRAKGFGGAQPNISQRIIRETKIPIIPLEKQVQKVILVRSVFECIDMIEETAINSIRYLENLEQSIMVKAFGGGLV